MASLIEAQHKYNKNLMKTHIDRGAHINIHTHTHTHTNTQRHKQKRLDSAPKLKV
jgi:hypothetical protein